MLYILSSPPSKRAAGLLEVPNWKIRRGEPRANPEQTQRTGISAGSAAAWGWWPSAERLLKANGNGRAGIKHRGCCADNFHIKGDK